MRYLILPVVLMLPGTALGGDPVGLEGRIAALEAKAAETDKKLELLDKKLDAILAAVKAPPGQPSVPQPMPPVATAVTPVQVPLLTYYYATGPNGACGSAQSVQADSCGSSSSGATYSRTRVFGGRLFGRLRSSGSCQ